MLNSKSQLETVINCYKTFDQILIEVGVKDPCSLYLCTNYVDRRLGYLMMYFNEHHIEYSPKYKKMISSCLQQFLDHLNENDTYVLPKSGTYKLEVPRSTLLDIVKIMNTENV